MMSSNWKPKTAQMCQRVTIAERVKVKNARGFTDVVLQDKLSACAAVDTWGGGLSQMDDADTSTDRIRVRLRYRSWIKEGLIVKYRGRNYEVSWVDHYDYRNDFLCLECKAVETDRA